jgi:hypothetical protein
MLALHIVISLIPGFSVVGDSGELDPMIPGKMVECIFVYCDVTSITEATGIMKSNVIVLLNRIAKVCI